LLATVEREGVEEVVEIVGQGAEHAVAVAVAVAALGVCDGSVAEQVGTFVVAGVLALKAGIFGPEPTGTGIGIDVAGEVCRTDWEAVAQVGRG
jgi:hypothetical protein